MGPVRKKKAEVTLQVRTCQGFSGPLSCLETRFAIPTVLTEVATGLMLG